MACSIVSTAGSATANSYASIAEGDTYHETHLYASDWTDAGSDDKCRALQMATRLLDQWWDWYGTKATVEQALRWPRSGALDRDGDLLDSDEIPNDIRDGTIELARTLIGSNITAESDSRGLKSVKAGSVELEFAVATPTVQTMPDAVAAFVSAYGTRKGANAGGAVTMQRG